MDMRKLLTTALTVPLQRETDVPLDAKDHLYGLPVCFVAEPGTSKSEIIESVCHELLLRTNVVFVPSRTAEDLGGYPVMVDGKLKRMTDDELIHELAEIGEGVVFLDEINTNSMNIYRTLLSVLLKRRYGGVQLSGRVRFLAARNPIESSAGGVDFPASIANRFCHIAWVPPSATQWCDWVLGFDENVTPIEPLAVQERRLITNWSSAWSDIAGKGTGFIRGKSGELHQLPQPGTPEFSGAWPSRRTWWWALRAMATAKALGAGEQIRLAFLKGCVGEPAMKAYLEWEKSADLPSAEEMLQQGFRPDTRRLDRSYAAYDTLTLYVASMKRGPQRTRAATKAWEILREACEAGGLRDTITRPASRLVAAGLGLSGGEECAAAAAPVLAVIQPINQRAMRAQHALEGV